MVGTITPSTELQACTKTSSKLPDSQQAPHETAGLAKKLKAGERLLLKTFYACFHSCSVDRMANTSLDSSPECVTYRNAGPTNPSYFLFQNTRVKKITCRQCASLDIPPLTKTFKPLPHQTCIFKERCSKFVLILKRQSRGYRPRCFGQDLSGFWCNAL